MLAKYFMTNELLTSKPFLSTSIQLHRNSDSALKTLREPIPSKLRWQHSLATNLRTRRLVLHVLMPHGLVHDLRIHIVSHMLISVRRT